jgi:hypothetical protein
MSDQHTHATSLEVARFWSDYLKHLTTLSTGSTVLIATFLEKIFSHPQWKAAIVISLAGFMGSILCSTIGFLWTGLIVDEMDVLPKDIYAMGGVKSYVGAGIVLITTFCFCVGILSLACFAIVNVK